MIDRYGISDNTTRMTSRRRPPGCEPAGQTSFAYHVYRIAHTHAAGIAASGHHRLMQAGFFRFLLAGNGVAAFQEGEPCRAAIVSEMQHGGSSGAIIAALSAALGVAAAGG